MIVDSVSSRSAAAPPPPVSVPQDTIDREQQNQEQRNRYEERQRELERAAPPPATTTPPDVPKAPPGQPACMNVTEIQIEGTHHLNSDDVAALTHPFVGRCVTLAELDHLITAINAAYVERGFVTSRAYVPQQKLDSGVLKLLVVEGTTEAIRAKDRALPFEAVMAFPWMIGNTLNLRDIEQGLEQINRLPSFNATMKIEPGEAQGSSVIIVDPAERPWLPGPWLRGHATIDNDGLTETGRNVARFGLDADNLLGLLDSWSLQDARSLTSHPDLAVSNEVSTSESLPFGYWTVFGSFDHSDYHSQVVGQAGAFEVSGVTDRYSMGINRVLARDQTSKTSIELGYELKETTSYLDDVLVQTSSENLASASIRLTQTERIWGGAWYLTLGYQRGLRRFGTSIHDEPSEPSTTPGRSTTKALSISTATNHSTLVTCRSIGIRAFISNTALKPNTPKAS